jgi:hypothetical protein
MRMRALSKKNHPEEHGPVGRTGVDEGVRRSSPILRSMPARKAKWRLKCLVMPGGTHETIG